jgi:plasmid stability protein
MAGKIAIRNIPPAVWEGLEALADQHDRSTEAEARHALRSWVEPLLQRNERSARCAEVSARMRDLLDQVNGARAGRSLKPSHIAQAIGEDYAETVENWFTGQVEPSFKQLDAIAEYLGGFGAWLLHGDASMFPVRSERIPEDPIEGVSWLLELELNENLTGLFFVRENDETGSLAVIKKYGDWRCVTYITPYHVSEVIGAGGEASLAHLSVIWQLLYRHYSNGGSRHLSIKSYLLTATGFRNLIEGNTHPLTILRDSAQDLPWWEDIWDVSQYPTCDYWPGWKALCGRIRRVVEMNNSLKEQDELIRLGKHPFFSSGIYLKQ